MHLANAMTLLRERAQRHSIALSLDADPQLGEIRADERKFKQVMLNLLSNAVKFTPDGGRVEVRARMADGTLEVAVRDSGIGIAKESPDAPGTARPDRRPGAASLDPPPP